jgi:hypothetical protein
LITGGIVLQPADERPSAQPGTWPAVDRGSWAIITTRVYRSRTSDREKYTPSPSGRGTGRGNIKEKILSFFLPSP